MVFNQILLEEKSRVEKELAKLSKLCEKYSGDTLLAKKSHESFSYYVKAPDSSRTYLQSSDFVALKRLAKETLDLKTLEDLSQQLRALNAYLAAYKTKNATYPYLLSSRKEAFLHAPAFQRLLADEAMAEDLREWAKAPYPKSERYSEDLSVKATGDLWVRSKSEAFIVSCLVNAGIPFHYEEEHYFDGVLMAPDFTIRHPRNRKMFIWEHFGLMDSEEYQSATAKKLYHYFKAGFIPDINLITTYETLDSPLDYPLVQQKISYWFS